MPDALPASIPASEVVSATPVAATTPPPQTAPATIPASDVVSATPVPPQAASGTINPDDVVSASPTDSYLHTQAPADIVSGLYQEMVKDPALKAAYASGTLTPEQEAQIEPYQQAYADQAHAMATAKNPVAGFLYSNSNDSLLGSALKVLVGLPKVAEDVDAATIEHLGAAASGVLGVNPITGQQLTGTEAKQAKDTAIAGVKLQAFQAANLVRQFTNRIANRIYASPLGDLGDIRNKAYASQFDTDIKAKMAEEGIASGASTFGENYTGNVDAEAAQRMSGSLLNPVFLLPGTEGAAAGWAGGFAARTLEGASAEAAPGMAKLARQAAGKVAAIPFKVTGAIAKPVAAAIDQNPLLAGVTYGGAAMAVGGSPADALMSTLMGGAAEGKARLLSRVAEGTSNIGNTLAGQIPNGPIGRMAMKAFDTAGDHVTGALVAQLGNTPFILGSDNREQAEQLMGFGLMAHAAGYAGGAAANALDIRGNLFSSKPTMPEQRTPVKPYGINDALDVAHNNAMSRVGNSGNNFVQAVRDYLGKKRGELYALEPTDYAAAMDDAAKSGHISQATADQGKGQAGITFQAADPDGGAPRTVSLSKVTQNVPGISVGHEAGHLVWKLLSPEEQNYWKQNALSTYGVDEINAYNQKYEALANKSLGPNDPPVRLNLADTPEEIFAEHASAVLNSIPIGQFSDPSMTGGVNLARNAYSLVGRALEKLHVKVPSLNGEVPVGQESGTVTGTGIEPSAVLGHIVENVLQAHRLDQPLFNGEQAAGEAYVPPATDTDVPGSSPIARPPAFKKGDPIDSFQKPGGKIVGTDAKVVKPLGVGYIDGDGVFRPGAGEMHYTVEYTRPGESGERRQGPVPESWLQSKSSNVSAKANETSPNAQESTVTPSTGAASVRSSPGAQNAAFGKQATPEDIAANKAIFHRIISAPTAPGAVEIVHNGAVTGAPDPDQIVRERERLLSEAAARTGDTSLKQPNQKVVVPFRDSGAKAPNEGVFALDSSKILQNAAMLGQWVRENAARVALNPAFKTAADYVESPAFKTDLQNYLKNQSNGYGGDGRKLVRPADTKPGTIPTENKAYSPVKISPENTNVLNALMGYNPAKSVRGDVVAASDYFRRFAEGSGGKLGKTALGLTEVNPFRAALVKAGFNIDLLNQATSQIRYRDVIGVGKARPDLNIHGGSTGITKAGFMPSVPAENEHAAFAGRQDGMGAVPDFNLYNLKHDIEGHPAGSTVSAQTLEKAGLLVPGVRPQGNQDTRDTAAEYMKGAGKPFEPHTEYARVNPERAKQLADFYEDAAHSPQHPEVQKAYRALTDETKAQWEAMTAAGIKAEPYEGKGEPYKDSAAMMKDVKENKHLWFLPTEGNFSGLSGNPLLENSGVKVNGHELLNNDLFRAVHDYFGHTAEGYEFGPRGEYNAYLAHSKMFSEEAKPALAAETLAQNSWVNYGRHLRRPDGSIPEKGDADFKPLAKRPFAEQKSVAVPAALLSEGVTNPLTSSTNAEESSQNGGTMAGSDVRFMPPADPTKEHVVEPAIKTEDGKIHRGEAHIDALYNAQDRGSMPTTEDPEDANIQLNKLERQDRNGFVSSTGRFLTRPQAFALARETGQVGPPRFTRDKQGLEAHSFAEERNFMPAMTQRLKGAVKEKTLDLVHYGQPGLNETNPEKFGKSGLTPRSELAGEPRSYFYVKGQENKADPSVERQHVYEASIPGHDIYDGDKDPLGYKRIVNRQAADEMLQSAGYRGISRTSGIGKNAYRQVELYDKQAVMPHNPDGSTGKPGTPSFMPNPSKEPFYDTIDRALDTWQPKGTPEQLLAHLLKTRGTKEQAAWIGLDDFLKDKKSVTKDEVRSFVQKNAVHVKDVTLASLPGGSQYKLDQYETHAEALENAAEKWENTDSDRAQKYRDEAAYERRKADGERKRIEAAKHVAGPTKYENYQLPGSKDYREILLTLPDKGDERFQIRVNGTDMGSNYGRASLNDFFKRYPDKEVSWKRVDENAPFQSSHFDEPNILAHVRYNERDLPDNKKLLFLEELQSDWHQKGRQQGYKAVSIEQLKAAKEKAEAAYKQKIEHLDNVVDIARAYQTDPETKRLFEDSERAHDAWIDALNKQSGVPDAPFKTSWPVLAMKRMIRLAAEKGMDKIGWTTGEQQAERYDLSKQVHSVGVEKNLDGTYLVYAKSGPRDVDRMINGHAKEAELENIIGKDLAKQAVEKTKDGKTPFKASGEGLKVGGEGMKGFYDKILPSVANELGKKFGTKVETSVIPSAKVGRPQSDGVGGLVKTSKPVGLTVHTMDVTPEMRASALQGMPLFQPDVSKGALAVTAPTRRGVLSGAGATRKKGDLAQ